MQQQGENRFGWLFWIFLGFSLVNDHCGFYHKIVLGGAHWQETFLKRKKNLWQSHARLIDVRPLILGYYMRRDRPSVYIYIGAGFAIHSFVGLNGRHFWSRAKWSACLLKELSLRRSQVPILMANSYSSRVLFRKKKLEFRNVLSSSSEHARRTWKEPMKYMI